MLGPHSHLREPAYQSNASPECVQHNSVNVAQADCRAIVRSVRLGDRSIDFCAQGSAGEIQSGPWREGANK